MISIHTPAKGVTLSAALAGADPIFQSTLPQREWPMMNLIAWLMVGFQSTLPQREWRVEFDSIRHNAEFQSTLPQREWRSVDYHRIPLSYFNPHSRKGSDPFHMDCFRRIPNFNPHSRKGSDTTYPATIRRNSSISIHTPAKGVTCIGHCATDYEK